MAYWPVFDAWNNSNGLDMPLSVHSIQNWLHPTPCYKNITSIHNRGYSVDFVSDKILSDKLTRATLTKRSKFDLYIISATNLMPVKTFNNISNLAKQGDIIVMQSLPSDVPGYSQLEAERKNLNELIQSLVFKSVDDAISEIEFGRGKIILSADIQKGLEYAELKRETLTDLGLKFIRRKIIDGKYYYIVNHTGNKMDTTIQLETASISVIILNPQTGEAGTAKSAVSKNNTTSVRV